MRSEIVLIGPSGVGKTTTAKELATRLGVPRPDKRASIAYLHERLGAPPEGWAILEHLITHPSNETLAKHVVYVEGRSPAEVADDVLRRVTPVDAPGR